MLDPINNEKDLFKIIALAIIGLAISVALASFSLKAFVYCILFIPALILSFSYIWNKAYPIFSNPSDERSKQGLVENKIFLKSIIIGLGLILYLAIITLLIEKIPF